MALIRRVAFVALASLLLPLIYGSVYDPSEHEACARPPDPKFQTAGTCAESTTQNGLEAKSCCWKEDNGETKCQTCVLVENPTTVPVVPEYDWVCGPVYSPLVRPPGSTGILPPGGLEVEPGQRLPFPPGNTPPGGGGLEVGPSP